MAFLRMINTKEVTVKEFSDVSKVVVKTAEGDVTADELLDLFELITHPKATSIEIHHARGTTSLPISLWQISTIDL